MGTPPTGISGTPAREEDWTLDPLGNWSGFVQKTSGSTDLDQSRSVNKVNEITDITESTGTAWVTPAYDGNGNMTTVPKPDDLANGFTCTYDSWNRLVKVEDGANTVAEYEYDARDFRMLKRVYDSGSLDHTRHAYFSRNWQVMEERIDSSSDPERQFVWGPRYIDHLILRDRDTSEPANSVLDERIYFLQDAKWNVTCLVDTAGDSIERYLYSPFGSVTILTPSWATRSTSSFAAKDYFTGRHCDPETGFFYFRFRYYDSALGRFMSRDPLEYIGGTSLYHAYFVPNGVDPYGLIEVTAVCQRVIGYDTSGDISIPIYERQEIQFDTGLGRSPCPPGWELYKWKHVPETPDDLIDNLCENLAKYPRCSNCSCDDLKKLLTSLREKARETKPVPWQPSDLLANQCERWCKGFEATHSVGFPNCVYQVMMHRMSWCLFGGHAAIRIVLCDGSVLFVDNGIIGGSDHIGVPGEAPVVIGNEGDPWETIIPNIRPEEHAFNY